MIIVDDINDDRIRHYRSLRYTPKSHTEENIFIAEGEKVVLRLLYAGWEPISIFCTEEYFEKYQSEFTSAEVSGCIIYQAKKKLMQEIIGFAIHNGVMAMFAQPENIGLTELQSPIIVLNKIVDSENTGAIIRNAVAFGLNSIIADEQSSSPWLRRAVRVSMGNIADMKVRLSNDIISDLKSLKSNGYSIISAEITDHSLPLDNIIMPDKYCIIFGSEGDGISPEILELSDSIIHIPINPKVNSINVAATSAVFFHHLQSCKG